MDISVIIPTYNRERKLKECLDSLLNQDYPRDLFEIIIVDDGSKDGTRETVAALSRDYPNIRYFYQSNKGPAAARNLGVKQAKSNIVAFSDSDCVLSPSWVRKMIQAHKADESIAAVGGITKVLTSNIKAVTSQFLSDGAIKVEMGGKLETIFLPTCNVSFKKKHLEEYFNELFPLPAGEDLEFFWRLFKNGKRFIHARDLEIFHNCHSNLFSFLRQALEYGRGNYLVQHIHKDHPLLKEIKIHDNFSFAFGTAVNFLKIPRFSYLTGKRLINSQGRFNVYERFKIYTYFTLHKIMYLIGNILEHQRLKKLPKDEASGVSYGSTDKLKPEFIILDITHRCNLKCNICEIRKESLGEEFTTEEVKDLIAQADEWGVKEFVFSGGEPLLREDVFEILDFVKKKEYRAGILTNGILLDNDFIKKLSPYLISNSLSLSISLDALTPRVHDGIRAAQGCFEKTLKGLKALQELKNHYPNINFNAISIILNENLEELLSLANFLKSLNVNSLQFQPLLANNLVMRERSSRDKYWIPPERLPVLDRSIDELIEFKRKNFQLVRNSEKNIYLMKKYFRGILNNTEVSCRYGIKTMLIANNGDVTTCFGCYGNVRKNRLKVIFNSSLQKQPVLKAQNCQYPCLLPCFCD